MINNIKLYKKKYINKTCFKLNKIHKKMSDYYYPPGYPGYGPVGYPPYGPYPPAAYPVPVPVPAPMVVPNPMCPRCCGTGMILGGHPCSCVGGSTKLHTAEKVEVGLGVTGAVLGVLGALHGPHW